MNLLDVFTIGSKILDRVLPDPQAKAAAQLELFKAQQAGEFKELDNQLQRDLAQIAVNQEEAKSESLFKSGWRPAVGWVCVIGLLYTYLAQPLLAWASATKGVASPPTLDLGDLIILLGGMLGLGTLRTAEKVKGVHK